MEDLFTKFSQYAYPAVVHQQQLGDQHAWLTEFWEKKITIIQNRLADHGRPFIAGTDRPTIADFKAFVYASTVFDRHPNNLYPAELRSEVQAMMNKAPEYANWFNTMSQELARYLAERLYSPL